LPYLTEHRIISPIPAEGNLLKWPLIPTALITYRFLAPELSAQFNKQATLQANDILNLIPTYPPLPKIS